jgi:hypothetical protein
MTRALVPIAALLLISGSSHAANPLAPLGRFQAQLVKGMNAVLKGSDPAKAFAPLTAVAKGAGAAELKAAGATSSSILAMEIELVFYVGAAPTYYLRTSITSTRKGPAFVGFAGRPIEGGKLFVKARPFADYKGPAAPLGATGAALARAVAGKACLELPVATSADFSMFPAGKMAERARRDLDRTKASIPAECAKLAALKSSKVELRVDDVAFAALARDGTMTGMIKTNLELDGGKLVLELGRYRAAPR